MRQPYRYLLPILFLLFVVFPAQVLAQTPTTADRMAQKQARLAQTETNLKNRADSEIQRRIDKLNMLITRINAMRRISADQKSSLTSQISTEISNLTSLKAKIDADTDATTLRTDVKSIVNSYRVFALFMPRIEVIAAADRSLNTAEKESTLAAKLSTRIQTDSSAGKDVSSLQTSLTDMQSKISDAKTQAQNAINTVMPLSPSDYPGNKGTLLSARNMIRAAQQDLVAGRKDAESIIQGLKVMRKASPTP